MSDFGDDIEYNDDLERVLQAAEAVVDIEDVVSPFDQFRRKGWLSVSDLVGTVWCEVQYDYRLRTMPHLPPAQRPSVIRSDKGKEIVVDKVKVEDKDRILKRGEKIHKRLEREIHPAEIVVQATTREDVWGLRFLNMLSALEALLTLGKCREIPVAGFVGEVLVMGIIDEVTREFVGQPTLEAYLGGTPTTHRLYVSDSKTRASGTLPRESDTLAGQLQCMMYKQLLDGMLRPDGDLFARLFAHLGLDEATPFSESFMEQSRPVVLGNALRHGAADARTLRDMLGVWRDYVRALGATRTEERLELVYRRAGKVRKKRQGRAAKDKPAVDGEEELAWAVEMSLMPLGTEEVTLPLSQGSETGEAPPELGSGSIIGHHRFEHDTALVERHLASVLDYWMGRRAPAGVGEDNVRRCGWCEFEEGCEWRADKAQEAWTRFQGKQI